MDGEFAKIEECGTARNTDRKMLVMVASVPSAMAVVAAGPYHVVVEGWEELSKRWEGAPFDVSFRTDCRHECSSDTASVVVKGIGDMRWRESALGAVLD